MRAADADVHPAELKTPATAAGIVAAIFNVRCFRRRVSISWQILLCSWANGILHADRCGTAIRPVCGRLKKKGWRPQPSPSLVLLGTIVQRDLETDHRPKGRAEIVMRAVGKIHFVAYIEAQANRADMRFQSATRIKRGHHVVLSQILDRA